MRRLLVVLAVAGWATYLAGDLSNTPRVTITGLAAFVPASLVARSVVAAGKARDSSFRQAYRLIGFLVSIFLFVLIFAPSPLLKKELLITGMIGLLFASVAAPTWMEAWTEEEKP